MQGCSDKEQYSFHIISVLSPLSKRYIIDYESVPLLELWFFAGDFIEEVIKIELKS